MSDLQQRLAELDAIAADAMPGPWDRQYADEMEQADAIIEWVSEWPEVAAHIAAADPTTARLLYAVAQVADDIAWVDKTLVNHRLVVEELIGSDLWPALDALRAHLTGGTS